MGRAPVELSRRASYGEEERIESVLVRWRDGRIARLEQARDDRISFALRDRYESAAPSCREQLAFLVTRHGPPESVTVAWRYLADWEGAPPVRENGSVSFPWPEVAAILALPVAGCVS